MAGVSWEFFYEKSLAKEFWAVHNSSRNLEEITSYYMDPVSTLQVKNEIFGTILYLSFSIS